MGIIISNVGREGVIFSLAFVVFRETMLQNATVKLLALSVLTCLTAAFNEPQPRIWTNHFAVELHNEEGNLEELAEKYGFSYHGRAGGLKNVHFFKLAEASPSARKRRGAIDEASELQQDPLIKSVTQQEGFLRDKRGFKPLAHFREKRDANSQNFDDELFDRQWYLKNKGQADGKAGLDLNVEEAWAQGITGKGVVIAIMDDGLDYLHPDLARNYHAEASYDFSSNDPYPYPRYTDDWFNSHGTRCAGEVSAVANNSLCVVGVAYESHIAGIRMLDQPYMTDMIEASSMSHKAQIIDIYSASWGPQDDGRTVDGPRDFTLKAIAEGVNEGRGGFGSIYVWASGDGGEADDCNCDGYASSMWTISINSAINDGRTALYDESCSSTLASTFSNGRNRHPEAGVATTDLYGKCTLEHSGTSAAAPEAAGVFALALEANRNLTWRDMQHLVVLTSKRNQLYDDLHQWRKNGAGQEFNHLFGFGVLDAGAIVRAAKTWVTVPERFHCTGGSYKRETLVPGNGSGKLKLTLNTDACAGQENSVSYLEHTQAVITLNSTRRGDVTINMTSPMGTTSILLSPRRNDDDSTNGFQQWPFMTTHSWGENPRGEWTLEVEMMGDGYLTLFEWSLVLHGTKEPAKWIEPFLEKAEDTAPQETVSTEKEKLPESDHQANQILPEQDDQYDRYGQYENYPYYKQFDQNLLDKIKEGDYYGYNDEEGEVDPNEIIQKPVKYWREEDFPKEKNYGENLQKGDNESLEDFLKWLLEY